MCVTFALKYVRQIGRSCVWIPDIKIRVLWDLWRYFPLSMGPPGGTDMYVLISPTWQYVCSIITYSGVGWCHLYLSNSPRNHPSPRTSPSHCRPPITYQLRRCCKLTTTADITDMGPYIYVFMKTSGYGNAFRIIGPCVENPTVKVESHTKEQWRWALMFFLFVVLTRFWTSNPVSGDVWHVISL